MYNDVLNGWVTSTVPEGTTCSCHASSRSPLQQCVCVAGMKVARGTGRKGLGIEPELVDNYRAWLWVLCKLHVRRAAHQPQWGWIVFDLSTPCEEVSTLLQIQLAVSMQAAGALFNGCVCVAGMKVTRGTGRKGLGVLPPELVGNYLEGLCNMGCSSTSVIMDCPYISTLCEEVSILLCASVW